MDAFGEVSPCVFTPMSFGNVHSDTVSAIFREMRSHFPSEESCFINRNFRLLQKHSAGEQVLHKAAAALMLQEVTFGEMSTFNRLYYGSSMAREATA